MPQKEKKKSACIPAKAPLSKPEATKSVTFTAELGNKKISSAVRFLSLFLCQN
jgi:hypothetical protein